MDREHSELRRSVVTLLILIVVVTVIQVLWLKENDASIKSLQSEATMTASRLSTVEAFHGIQHDPAMPGMGK